MEPRGAVDFVYKMVEKHTEKFKNSLPMIASENLISPLARRMLVTDLTDRYAEGLPRKRYYQGNEFFDEIEILGTELAKRLFRAKEADLRPISGTVANMAVFFAFAEPGDTYTALSLNDGAHISSAAFGAAGLRGLNEVTYPFDYENMNIDVDKTIKMLKEVKPKLALFGRSVFLFPSPIKELKDTLEEIGAV
ncbi:MAG: serine hydroxymethyltransferase, partial [Thermoplasmata archaeon]|nr:serine hydroxymethyltransferase [Thermoplasmata archaeon]